MFIQNCGRRDIELGFHADPGPNAVLIQISDPPGNYPEPHFEGFSEIYQFDFLDAEDSGSGLLFNSTADYSEFIITQEQANKIAVILEKSLRKKQNVIVHCNAGICRSGAVCEVGVMLGFEDTGRFRNPNLTVKRKLMQALGLGYYDV